MEFKNPGILKGLKRDYKEKLIHRYIDDINFKAQNALIYEDENESVKRIKYRDLIEYSNKLARATLNVANENSWKPNSNGSFVIGILMKPSIDAIITMLSILKCGASYFPINPYYTRNRLQDILNEVKPQLVIVDNEIQMENIENIFVMEFNKLKLFADELSPSYLIDDFSLTLGKNAEALIIYTSGTLGIPKGTPLKHSQLQTRLEWQWEKFPFDENETHCISRFSYWQIDHFAEIFGALCAGKILVIIDEKFQKDEAKLIEIFEKYKIRRFTAYPNLIKLMLKNLKENEKSLNNLKLWISTGEQLTKSVAQNFFNCFPNNHKLVNFYGCTETTGECASYTIESSEHLKQLTDDEIPIGSPTFNTHIYVMNKELSVTEGLGEIFVSGEMVAYDYVHEDEENASIFSNHLSILPAYLRLFRTGDYGIIHNGLLYFHGRSKRMIRINENLIDLSTIENFLNTLEYISKAAVAIKNEEKSELLVFVTLERGFSYITEKIIQRKLSKMLPSYVETEIFIIYEMPTTVKDDIDYYELLNKYDEIAATKRRRTIAIDINVDDIREDEQEYARQVFEIIADCIGPTLTGSMTSKSNFYELGGTSLNLMHTIVKLSEAKFYISTEDFLRSKSLGEIFEKCMKSRGIQPILTLEPQSTLKIAVITELDREKCAQILAKCYSEKNELMKFINNLKKENLFNFLEANWKFFVDRGLSFKVVGKNDEILGVSLNYERVDESLLNKSAIETMEPIEEFIELAEDKIIETQYPNEQVLTPFMMGTSTSFTPEENIRVVFMMEDHLIRLLSERNFKVIVAIESCSLNAQIHKSIHGYETVKEFQANRFINKNGQRPFESAADTLKTFVQVYLKENDGKMKEK